MMRGVVIVVLMIQEGDPLELTYEIPRRNASYKLECFLNYIEILLYFGQMCCVKVICAIILIFILDVREAKKYTRINAQKKIEDIYFC